MEINWYGTATLSFASEGKSIVFDPFISINNNINPATLTELAELGDIFITHAHFDHIIDVPRLLDGSDQCVYCSGIAAQVLRREGVNPTRLNIVGPGDTINNGPFRIKVFSGKHVVFNPQLIKKTLLGLRVRKYYVNLMKIIRSLPLYPAGEVLVYLIEAEGKKILHFGSMNIQENEVYPEEVDIFTMPFQGRSDLATYTLPFLEKIKPKAVLLHHYDDTFPPLSSRVNYLEFCINVEKNYDNMQVIIPVYQQPLFI